MSIFSRRNRHRCGRAARRRLIDNRRAFHQHRLEPLEPRMLLAADLFGAILLGEGGIDEVAPGDDLDIDLFVDNIGDMPASGSIEVDLFAVMGDPFDPDKIIELGTQRFTGTLNPDDFAERSLTVDIPTNAMPGIYTLVAIIDAGDALAESNENNNFVVGDQFLIFQPDYDLVPGINSVSVPPAIVFGQAANGSVSVNITNPMDSIATIPSGVTVGVQVFAAPDGGDGILLNTKAVNVSVSKLAPGKSKSVTVPIQFPNNLPIDTYNLVVFIDVSDALSETNENNNDLLLMESVIVADPFFDLTAAIGAGLKLPPGGFVSGAGDVVTVPVEITNRGNEPIPAGQMVRVLVGLGDPPLAAFGARTDFTVGDGPFSVALGDVNGDGRPDIVTANQHADSVSVLLGDGKGGFNAAAAFNVGDEPRSLTLGDVNGDDNLDIVTANYASQNVSVLLGNGAGGFAAAMNFDAGNSQWAIALGDLNGDDDLDIVTANYSGGNVTVLLGDGTGMFGAPTNFAAGGGLLGLALGFVNGDDNLDIVASNYEDGSVAVLLGDGVGGFGAAMNFDAQTGIFGVALGDVNGDDHLDVVTGNYYEANRVAVLLGDGAGNFGAPTFFGVGEFPHSVALGDVNGDGLLDIVAPNRYDENVSVLLGDGTGGFDPSPNFNTGDGPQSLALGDLNGDGVLDIVTANQFDDSVSVLLGSTNTADVSVGGLKPGQTKVVNVKATIPQGLPNMETYFHAVIDTGDALEETDENNNTANSAFFGILEGVRDLSVAFGAGLKLPTAPIISGDGTKLKLPIEITNMGNLPLAKGQTIDVRVQIVDAPDGAPVGGGSSGTTDIMVIEGVSLSNLAPGKTKKVTLNVTLPTLISANNYFLQVLIDDDNDVQESNEGNNTATTAQDIDVLFGFIDLTAVKDPAAAIPMALVAGAGTTFDFPILLTNGGNVALPSGQKINIDIFARPVAGGADILLGSANGVSISKLKAGATKKITVKKLAFPSSAKGDFIFVTRVDTGGAVVESEEDNNESDTEGDAFFESTLNQQADQGATPFQLFNFAEPVTLSQLLFVPTTHRGALGFGIGEIVFRGADGTTIAPTGASSFDSAMIYAPGITADGWDLTFSPAGGSQLSNFAQAFADLAAGPTTVVNGAATVNITDSATNPGDPGRPFGNHAEIAINNPNTSDQNDYAMMATATLVIETAGVYDFGFAGDDGGLLRIAGQPFSSIIENSTGQTVLADFFDTGVADTLLCNCLTPNSNSVGRIALEPGEYDITVAFFERGGGSWFEVFARGNGLFQLLGGDPSVAANASVIGNTFDLSGFSAAYMSGVSDFDDLFAANPTHNSTPAANVFITSDVNRNVPWTFDFGGPVELDGFAASNLTGTMGVANFRLVDATNRMVIFVAEPHVDLVGVKDPAKPLVMSLVADAQTKFDYSIIITNNGNIPVPAGPPIFVDVFGVPVGGGEETFLGSAEVSVSGLKPGAAKKVTIRGLFFDAGVEGEFDIVAVIDAENDVDERDEDNNDASSEAAGMTVVVAEPFVDLTAAIGAAFSLPGTGIISGSGQTVTLPIEIMNSGNVPLDAGQMIDVFIGITNAPDGAPVAGGGSGGLEILTQRVSVSGLKPGVIKKVDFKFPMPDGLGSFEAVFAVFLDDAGEVDESDEDNRFDTPPFEVFQGTRDLTVAIGAGIKLPEQTITSGDGTKLTIPIEITNGGNLPLAGGQMIDVAVFTSPVPDMGAGAGSGGDLIGVFPVSVSGLQPGAVKKQTLSATLPPGIGAGEYNLLVVVDDGDDVDESNEMNNSATTAGAIDVLFGFIDILAGIGAGIALPQAPIISGSGATIKVPIEVTNIGNVPLPNGQQVGWYILVDPFEGGGAAVDPHHIDQFASSVIKFSSQYNTEGDWAAAQVLGEPDTFAYGDFGTAWATEESNDGIHFITVGYDTPVVATGVTVRETWGNGFVRKIEVRDTKGKFQVVFDGVDPSQPGAPVDFFVDFPPTPFLVNAVRVTIDTDHNPDTWEEIDSITLHGIDAIAAGSINASNLKPDAMKKATATVNIPQSVMDGTHVLTLETFLIGDVDEENEAPNSAMTDPFAVVQGFVDLAIMIDNAKVNLPPLLLAGDGSTFDLPIVIQNMGNLPVPSGGKAFINIFASEEGEDGVQIGMAEVSLSKLKPGAMKAATVKKLMIPEGHDGLFHIAADMFNFSAGVNDADEDNNDAETEQAIDVYANFLDLLGFTEELPLPFFGQRTGRDVPTGDALVNMTVQAIDSEDGFDFFEVRFAIEMLGDGAGGGGSLPLFDDEGFVFGTNGHAVVEAHFFRVPEMIADFAPGIDDLLTIGGVGEQGPILQVGKKYTHTVPLDDMFFEGLVNDEFFSFELLDGTSTSMTRLVRYEVFDSVIGLTDVAIIEMMLDHQATGQIEDGEVLRNASVRLTSMFTFYVDSFGIVRFESSSRLRGSISGVGSFDRQSNLMMDID